MKKNWVVITNGHEKTREAILYAGRLAAAMDESLTLLGIVEKDDEKHPLEEMFNFAVPFFHEMGVSYSLQVANGQTEHILARRDWSDTKYLFVGPLGRSSTRRFLAGRSIRSILEEVAAPIFYIREARLPMQKILICLGGLGYAGKAEEIALHFAKRLNASATFLHVVPPIDWEYPPAQELEAHWKNLLETDSLPARTMRRALDAAREAAIPAEARVRHGEVTVEILQEIRDGAYDLVCMGSPHSPHSLRHFYAPNVPAEIAEECRVPLLTARFAPKFVQEVA